MKKFAFSFLFLFSLRLFAQVGYVDVKNPVYNFLERMSVRKIIPSYNSFELPKSEKEIGKWLRKIGRKLYKLNATDKEIFRQFKSEFEYVYEETYRKYYSLLTSGFSKEYPFGRKEKYLYFFSDENKSLFYVNLLGKTTFLNRVPQRMASSPNNAIAGNATAFVFGGEIGGTLFDKFGFKIEGLNGTYRGNKKLVDTFEESKFNYKFNYTQKGNIGANYFDNTEGYAAYENNWLQAKIGSDRNLFGEGILKDILSDNSPRQNYISLKLNYKAFSFTFYNAKLLGLIFDNSANSDFSEPKKKINEKYFVYHRFGLHLFDNTFFNVGEMIIYNFRQWDLAYLNPFNFYKSAEHANQDRDNSMLFFDLSNSSIPNLKLFASLIIDDLDFSKIGTNWLGNQTVWNVGFYSTVLNKYLPLDVEAQYLRLSPFVYTHRFLYNNYTNSGYNLGAALQPNSYAIAVKFIYTPGGKLKIDLTALYSRHGENSFDEEGNLIKNVGGNINFGYRKEDLPDAVFLDGLKESLTSIKLDVLYEIINNYYIFGNAEYLVNKDISDAQSYFDLILGIKFRL